MWLRLTRMAYFFHSGVKLTFENLHILEEKTACKPSTKTKCFFFHLLLVRWGGEGGENDIEGLEISQNISKFWWC